MYKKLSFILASAFGAGYAPKGPGTFGSLVTLPMVWLCAQYSGLSGVAALAIVSFVLGCIATREVLKHTKHDPSFVVIDEVAGQSMAFILVTEYLNVWWVYLLGFVLFRIFDIFKIGPVKYFDEKVENEYGVMMDDVIAGLIAAVILKLALTLII